MYIHLLNKYLITFYVTGIAETMNERESKSCIYQSLHSTVRELSNKQHNLKRENCCEENKQDKNRVTSRGRGLATLGRVSDEEGNDRRKS